MEFREIDTVLGDSLTPGDLFYEDGSHLRILSIGDDEGDMINVKVYNLDEDENDDWLVNPDENYVIFEVS